MSHRISQQTIMPNFQKHFPLPKMVAICYIQILAEMQNKNAPISWTLQATAIFFKCFTPLVNQQSNRCNFSLLPKMAATLIFWNFLQKCRAQRCFYLCTHATLRGFVKILTPFIMLCILWKFFLLPKMMANLYLKTQNF